MALSPDQVMARAQATAKRIEEEMRRQREEAERMKRQEAARQRAEALRKRQQEAQQRAQGVDLRLKQQEDQQIKQRAQQAAQEESLTRATQLAEQRKMPPPTAQPLPPMPQVFRPLESIKPAQSVLDQLVGMGRIAPPAQPKPPVRPPSMQPMNIDIAGVFDRSKQRELEADAVQKEAARPDWERKAHDQFKRTGDMFFGGALETLGGSKDAQIQGLYGEGDLFKHKEAVTAADKITRIAGNIVPFVAAGATMSSLGIAPTTGTVLSKFAPKFMAKTLGRTIPIALERAATGATVETIKQTFSDKEEGWNVTDSIKEISKTAGLFGAWAFSSAIIGEPTRQTIAKLLPEAMNNKVVPAALGNVLSQVAGSAPVAAAMGGLQILLNYWDNPEVLFTDEAGEETMVPYREAGTMGQDYLTQSLFYFGMDVAFGLLGLAQGKRRPLGTHQTQTGVQKMSGDLAKQGYKELVVRERPSGGWDYRWASQGETPKGFKPTKIFSHQTQPDAYILGEVRTGAGKGNYIWYQHPKERLGASLLEGVKGHLPYDYLLRYTSMQPGHIPHIYRYTSPNMFREGSARNEFKGFLPGEKHSTESIARMYKAPVRNIHDAVNKLRDLAARVTGRVYSKPGRDPGGYTTKGATFKRSELFPQKTEPGKTGITDIGQKSRRVDRTTGDFTPNPPLYGQEQVVPGTVAKGKVAYGGTKMGPTKPAQEVQFSNKAPIAIPAAAEYRGAHVAPDSFENAPLYDMTQLYPDDIYSPQAAQNYGHYGGNNPLDVAAAKAILGYRNQPDKPVTIYRAVPTDAGEEINPGDWVTMTKEYAIEHGESNLEGEYKVISKSVTARDLFTDANSIHEFGYVPQLGLDREATPGYTKPEEMMFSGRGEEITDRPEDLGDGRADREVLGGHRQLPDRAGDETQGYLETRSKEIGRKYAHLVKPVEAQSPEGAALLESSRNFYETSDHGMFGSPMQPVEGGRIIALESGVGGTQLVPDGDAVDIQSVFFNRAKAQELGLKGNGNSVLLAALREGGNTLDCFGGPETGTHSNLTDLYGRLGFVPVARVMHSREYAPERWNYDRDGEAEVVMFVHSGDTEQFIVNNLYPVYDLNQLPLFEANDYDRAKEAQHDALKLMKQRGGLDEHIAERRNQDTAEEMREGLAGGLERRHGQPQGVPEGGVSIRWVDRRQGGLPGSDTSRHSSELFTDLSHLRQGYLQVSATNWDDKFNAVIRPSLGLMGTNVTINNSRQASAGHEVEHDLQVNTPWLYLKTAEAMDLAAWGKSMRNRDRIEELTADYFGELTTLPHFWQGIKDILPREYQKLIAEDGTSIFTAEPVPELYETMKHFSEEQQAILDDLFIKAYREYLPVARTRPMYISPIYSPDNLYLQIASADQFDQGTLFSSRIEGETINKDGTVSLKMVGTSGIARGKEYEINNILLRSASSLLSQTFDPAMEAAQIASYNNIPKEARDAVAQFEPATANKLGGVHQTTLSRGCMKLNSMYAAVNAGIMPAYVLDTCHSCHFVCYKNTDNAAQTAGSPVSKMISLARELIKNPGKYSGEELVRHEYARDTLKEYAEMVSGIKLTDQTMLKKTKDADHPDLTAVKSAFVKKTIEERREIFRWLDQRGFPVEFIPYEARGQMAVVTPEKAYDLVMKKSDAKWEKFIKDPNMFIRGNHEGDAGVEIQTGTLQAFLQALLDRPGYTNKNGEYIPSFKESGKQYVAITSGWYTETNPAALKELAEKYGDILTIHISGPLDFPHEVDLRFNAFLKYREAGLRPIMRVISDEFDQTGAVLNDPVAIERFLRLIIKHDLGPNEFLDTALHLDDSRIANTKNINEENINTGISFLLEHHPDLTREDAARMAENIILRNNLHDYKSASGKPVGKGMLGLTYGRLEELGMPKDLLDELRARKFSAPNHRALAVGSRPAGPVERVFPNGCCETGKCSTCGPQCMSKIAKTAGGVRSGAIPREALDELVRDIIADKSPSDASGLMAVVEKALDGDLMFSEKITPAGDDLIKNGSAVVVDGKVVIVRKDADGKISAIAPDGKISVIGRGAEVSAIAHDSGLTHGQFRRGIRALGYTMAEVKPVIEKWMDQRGIDTLTNRDMMRLYDHLEGHQDIRITKAQPVSSVVEKMKQEAGTALQTDHSTGPVSRVKGKGYSVIDPAVQARIEANHGVNTPSFYSKIWDASKEFGRYASRTHRHLANIPYNMQLRSDLIRLEKSQGIAGRDTVDNLKLILQPVIKDKYAYEMLSRKVLFDDLRENYDRYLDHIAENDLDPKENPYDGWDKYEIGNVENFNRIYAQINTDVQATPEVLKALENRQAYWDSLVKEYTDAMKVVGTNVEEAFTRTSYYRNMIMDMTSASQSEDVVGYGDIDTGGRQVGDFRRGFHKGRKVTGTAREHNTNYLEVEFSVITTMLHDINRAGVYKNLEEMYDHRDVLVKLAEKANEDLVEGQDEFTWRDFIGHEDAVSPVGGKLVPFHPLDVNMFFMAHTIPEKQALRALQDGLKEINISTDQIREIQARANGRNPFMVDENVAKTLHELEATKSKKLEAWLIWRSAMGMWKQWHLISPPKWVKYNIRNFSSDVEMPIISNMNTFKHMGAAVKELGDYAFRGKTPSPTMKAWMDRGGLQSGLTGQEMGEINNLKEFKRVVESTQNFAKKGWETYWRNARLTNDFRESWLRYASFKSYLQQMARNIDPAHIDADGNISLAHLDEGRPDNFGASIKGEIMALRNIYDRGYWLSNELCGAYDRISEFGKMMRTYVYPFWSWQEVNLKRYYRFVNNALDDGDLIAKIGQGFQAKLGAGPAGAASGGKKGVLTRTAITAYKLGRLWLGGSILGIAAQAWNNAMFPDHEDALSEDEMKGITIIVGRKKDGSYIYFNRLGYKESLNDWIGDQPYYYRRDLATGRKTLGDVAMDIMKAPANLIMSGLGPHITMPYENIAGITLWPDPENPRFINDKMRHQFANLGLTYIYDKLAGNPTISFKDQMSKLIAYTAKPGQGAYYRNRDEVDRFLKEIGRARPTIMVTGERTDTSQATFDMRTAIRLGDLKSFEKAALQYALAGGDYLDFERNLAKLHPLDAVPEEFRDRYVNEWLDDRGRQRLEAAEKFYEEDLLGEEYVDLLKGYVMKEMTKQEQDEFLTKLRDRKLISETIDTFDNRKAGWQKQIEGILTPIGREAKRLSRSEVYDRLGEALKSNNDKNINDALWLLDKMGAEEGDISGAMTTRKIVNEKYGFYPAYTSELADIVSVGGTDFQHKFMTGMGPYVAAGNAVSGVRGSLYPLAREGTKFNDKALFDRAIWAMMQTPTTKEHAENPALLHRHIMVTLASNKNTTLNAEWGLPFYVPDYAELWTGDLSDTEHLVRLMFGLVWADKKRTNIAKGGSDRGIPGSEVNRVMLIYDAVAGNKIPYPGHAQ